MTGLIVTRPWLWYHVETIQRYLDSKHRVILCTRDTSRVIVHPFRFQTIQSMADTIPRTYHLETLEWWVIHEHRYLYSGFLLNIYNSTSVTLKSIWCSAIGHIGATFFISSNGVLAFQNRPKPNTNNPQTRPPQPPSQFGIVSFTFHSWFSKR